MRAPAFRNVVFELPPLPVLRARRHRHGHPRPHPQGGGGMARGGRRDQHSSSACRRCVWRVEPGAGPEGGVAVGRGPFNHALEHMDDFQQDVASRAYGDSQLMSWRLVGGFFWRLQDRDHAGVVLPPVRGRGWLPSRFGWGRGLRRAACAAGGHARALQRPALEEMVLARAPADPGRVELGGSMVQRLQGVDLFPGRKRVGGFDEIHASWCRNTPRRPRRCWMRAQRLVAQSSRVSSLGASHAMPARSSARSSARRRVAVRRRQDSSAPCAGCRRDWKGWRGTNIRSRAGQQAHSPDPRRPRPTAMNRLTVTAGSPQISTRSAAAPRRSRSRRQEAHPPGSAGASRRSSSSGWGRGAPPRCARGHGCRLPRVRYEHVFIQAGDAVDRGRGSVGFAGLSISQDSAVVRRWSLPPDIAPSVIAPAMYSQRRDPGSGTPAAGCRSRWGHDAWR